MRGVINSILVVMLTLLGFSSCVEMSEKATYAFDKFYFYEDSIAYSGPLMVFEAELFGENKLTVPYYSLEETDKVLSIDPATLVLPEGLGLELVNNTIPALVGDGTLNFVFTGTPTKVGSTAVTFDLVCGDNRWFFRVDNVEVLKVIDALGLKDVTLKGPAFDDERYYAENYQLTVSYTNVEAGYTLDIDTIVGYLSVDADVFAASADELKLELTPTGEGVWITQTYDLPDDLLDATVDENGNFTETPASLGDIAVKFRYNETYLAEDSTYVYNAAEYDGYVQEDLTVLTMRSRGYAYKTKELDNGQIWLDRNLGAKNIAQQPVTLNGNSLDDNWVVNYDVYGKYFHCGYKTGISILRDGNNPLLAQSYGVAKYGNNTTETYTVISSSAYPDIPYFPVGGTWADGCYTEYDGDGVSVNTGYTNDMFYERWNNTSTGGIHNPCPSGYRLPTSEEVLSMIETVVGLPIDDLSSDNPYVLAALIGKMNFAPSGYIYRGGIVATINTVGGNTGMVGLMGTGVKTPTGATTSYSMINRPSDANIFISTCDDLRGVGATYKINPVHIGASGAVTSPTYGSYGIARNPTTGIVRCIKHQ